MDYYDDLETQRPADREAHIRDALPEQIAHAQEHSAVLAKILEGVDAEFVTGREELAKLPVVRRSRLLEFQEPETPFDGVAAATSRNLARIFRAPDGVYIPEARRADYWRFARALFAAGFRRGDLIYNAFSYHFAPAGWMVENGAWALGCVVFPAGPERPELQAEALADLKPQGYAGTPSVLKALLDKAAELKTDVSSLRQALLFEETLSPEWRLALKERGIDAYQCYATPELGLIAYETPALEGMVVDEGVLVEIVDPDTDQRVPDGEVGEVVVTTFNPDYPLVRFGTGDLSAILPGPSPCGRTNTRIKGWLGRVDRKEADQSIIEKDQ